MRQSRYRRRILQGVSAVAVGGFAGCSVLSETSPMFSLKLYNRTDTLYTVYVDLFRADGGQSGSTEPTASVTVEVSPKAEVRRDRFVERQPYLIQFEVYDEKGRETDDDHVHYIPQGEGDGKVILDIEPPGELNRRRG